MARRLNSKADELVLNNQGLVRHIVINKFNVSYDDIDDYVSMGNIGLIKAANTFDESKGIKFASYAGRCITNEILMYLRKQKLHGDYIYLDDAISNDGEGNDLTLLDKIPSSDGNLIEIFEKYEFFIQCFNIILNALNSKERLVLLYKIAGYTQDSIAELLNISQSYTSRLERKSISKVKSYLTLDKQFKKVFSMSIVDDLYQIRFSSKDIQQFDKIFATLLQKLESDLALPDFKIISNKERIIIQFPAESESFSFIAKIIQEIDKSSIAYVSNKNLLISGNTVSNITPKVDTKLSSNVNLVSKGNQTKQIRDYISDKKSFNVKELKEKFTDIPAANIGPILYFAKKEGLIEGEGKGNYIVVANKT